MLNVKLSSGDTKEIYLVDSDLEKTEEQLIEQIKKALPKPTGKGKQKGGEFERQIGYKLSLWLSKGTRKDLLCRTVGSGAQFTSANLRNQSAGIPGDLRSQDPLADKFCATYVIECKFWKNLDILNFLRGEGELYKALVKVQGEGAMLHKSYMLIARQNNRPDILLTNTLAPVSHHVLFGGNVFMYILDTFLNRITPEVLLGNQTSTDDSSAAAASNSQ